MRTESEVSSVPVRGYHSASSCRREALWLGTEYSLAWVKVSVQGETLGVSAALQAGELPAK